MNNPKYQIDLKVEDENSGQRGQIKGIRLVHSCIDNDEGETVFETVGWEYNIWYMGSNYSAIDYHKYRYPNEPLTPEDYQIWKEWGWIKEADLLPLQ